MKKHEYPRPPRSACAFCPYHSNEEWRIIKKDKIITERVSEKRINSIFAYNKHFKNVNFIFRRVFK